MSRWKRSRFVQCDGPTASQCDASELRGGPMKMRIRSLVVGVAIVSSLVTWTWAAAQATAVTPVPPRVMTGGDIGFRVVGLRGETPVGRIVVRVNERWVDAELAAAVQM